MRREGRPRRLCSCRMGFGCDCTEQPGAKTMRTTFFSLTYHASHIVPCAGVDSDVILMVRCVLCGRFVWWCVVVCGGVWWCVVVFVCCLCVCVCVLWFVVCLLFVGVWVVWVVLVCGCVGCVCVCALQKPLGCPTSNGADGAGEWRDVKGTGRGIRVRTDVRVRLRVHVVSVSAYKNRGIQIQVKIKMLIRDTDREMDRYTYVCTLIWIRIEMQIQMSIVWDVRRGFFLSVFTQINTEQVTWTMFDHVYVGHCNMLFSYARRPYHSCDGARPTMNSEILPPEGKTKYLSTQHFQKRRTSRV